MNKGTRFFIFFSNLFNVHAINDSRLQLFCRFVIATLTTANIGGVLDDVLLPLKATYLAYFGDSKEKTVNKAIKESSTSGLNSVVKNFADAVRDKHHLIASIYPEGSMVYIEFFPGGLTAFSKLTRGNILDIANQFSETATKYNETLGGLPFSTIFTDCNAAIIAALGVQVDKKGVAKKINSQIITKRAPVENALMAVMFKIGSMYGPNWDKCLSFFDFSLLTASHHSKGIYANGELTGLQKSNCMDEPISNTSIILLKNPNIVPIYYFVSSVKDGVMVGVEIEMKPNTNLVVAYSDFGSLVGLFLNVKNMTDYTVQWEVHVD